MTILTEAQQLFLRTAASVPLVRRDFFLTGGTALAEYVLHHRLSEDLDLFTAVPNAVPLALVALRAPLEAAGFTVEVIRAFDTFTELRVRLGVETIKVDLAQDTPFRLAPTIPDEAHGLARDSLDDLSANKVAALFGRAEPKDFVDVYFLQREHGPLDALIEKARAKHLGIDDYWLAQAFARAKDVGVLPRMIRPLTIDELREFFVAEADRRMRLVMR